MNSIFKWHGLLFAFCLTGCSFDLIRNQTAVQVNISLPERTRSFPPHDLSRNFLAQPSTLDDFDCFAVNVYGPGISMAAPWNQTLNARDFPGCPYPGVLSKLISGTELNSPVLLQVPSGTSRTIQVIGLKDGMGCRFNSITDYFDPSQFTTLTSNDLFVSKVGSMATDLISGAEVSIPNTFIPPPNLITSTVAVEAGVGLAFSRCVYDLSSPSPEGNTNGLVIPASLAGAISLFFAGLNLDAASRAKDVLTKIETAISFLTYTEKYLEQSRRSEPSYQIIYELRYLGFFTIVPIRMKPEDVAAIIHEENRTGMNRLIKKHPIKTISYLDPRTEAPLYYLESPNYLNVIFDYITNQLSKRTN